METELTTISCPYCGEHFEVQIDASAGNHQYIEDCYVCCQPIMIHVTVSYDGSVEVVWVAQENE